MRCSQGPTRPLQVQGGRVALADPIDFYLIHWPNPLQDKYVDTWRALIEVRERGLVRVIGVSNFLPGHIERLEAATGVLPTVNQIESHPRFPNTGLIAYDAERGIATEAWSPLGRDSNLLAEAVIVDVAAAHAITAAQVVLAWHVARGVTPISKYFPLKLFMVAFWIGLPGSIKVCTICLS